MRAAAHGTFTLGPQDDKVPPWQARGRQRRRRVPERTIYQPPSRSEPGSSEVLFTPTNFQPSFSFHGLALSPEWDCSSRRTRTACVDSGTGSSSFIMPSRRRLRSLSSGPDHVAVSSSTSSLRASKLPRPQESQQREANCRLCRFRGILWWHRTPTGVRVPQVLPPSGTDMGGLSAVEMGQGCFLVT